MDNLHQMGRNARSVAHVASPWSALVLRSALTTLILWVVECVGFAASYARGFVTAQQWFELYLLGLAVALVMALPLACSVACVQALEGLFDRSSFRNRRFGAALEAAASCALMVVLGLCQDGHLLRPPSALQWLAIALLTASIYVAARVLQRAVTPARENAFACAILVLWLWFFLDYETLALFSRASFGVSDAERLLRTLVALCVPLTLLFGGALLTRRRQLNRRAAAWWALVAALLLLPLQRVSLTQFVDLHPQIHSVILLVSAVCAWQLVDFVWGHRAALAVSVRTRWSYAALFVCAAAWIVTRPPGDTARYVATVHSVGPRFGLELVYGDVLTPTARVRRSVRMLQRASFVLRGRSLPFTTSSMLPSTFAKTELVRDDGSAPPRAAVLFILDMKRARDIGPDATGHTRTPKIDRCFAGGARFDRALSASTRTLTSLPSIYSSTYAATQSFERPDVPVQSYWSKTAHDQNLVSAFRSAGYFTRVLTNDYYLRFLRTPFYEPVFGRFDDIVVADEALGENAGLMRRVMRPGGIVPDAERFLLVVHVFAHGIDTLSEIDDVIGAVCEQVAARRHADQTVLMLTSDHGFQLREHGRTTYGRTLFNEELQVPLLWRAPGVRPRHVRDAVSSLDHLPTLIELFGLPATFPVEGRSYLHALRGEPLDPKRPIYFEATCNDAPQLGVEQDGYKLVRWTRTGTFALFDETRDPAERHNLADRPEHRARLHAMSGLLASFVRERGLPDMDSRP